MTYRYQKTWPPPNQLAYDRLKFVSRAPAAPANNLTRVRNELDLLPRTSGRMQSVLAITDLGPESETLLSAAAKFALQQGMALYLAYYCRKPQHGFTNPIERLTQRARHLSRHHQMQIRLGVNRELSEKDVPPLAQGFDLVFIQRDQLLQRSFFWSSPLIRRLLDHARIRVMAYTPSAVIPGPNAIVASRNEAAVPTLVSALCMLGDTKTIELLHVVDGVNFPSLDELEKGKGILHHTLRQYWLEVRKRFDTAISTLSPVVKAKIDLVLAHGDTRSEILKRLHHRSGSTLVLGWQQRARPLSLMRDRLVLRLLRDVEASVLLVPLHRSTQST